jgi:hypothetical protein
MMAMASSVPGSVSMITRLGAACENRFVIEARTKNEIRMDAV